MSAFDPKRTSGDETIPIKLFNWVRNGAQPLEALQNNCVPSRWLALGHAGCEHVLIAHDLPVPVRVTLPDAAIKNRLGQKELSLAGGSVGQLPRLQKNK
jgi:hypothetical protein